MWLDAVFACHRCSVNGSKLPVANPWVRSHSGRKGDGGEKTERNDGDCSIRDDDPKAPMS